jgi:hypothetical protein
MKSVDSTPFSVQYSITSTDAVTEDDYDEAAAATIAYLQNYLTDVYGLSRHITLEKVDATKIGDTGDGTPVRIGYDLVAIFDQEAGLVPEKIDVDKLISQSMIYPDNMAFYESLRQLPQDNPFSTTNAVKYSTLDVPDDAEADSLLVPFIVTIAGTFGVLVLSVGILARIRRRKVERSVMMAKVVALQDEPTSEYSESANSGDYDNSTIEEYDETANLPYATAIDPGRNSLFGRL